MSGRGVTANGIRLARSAKWFFLHELRAVRRLHKLLRILEDPRVSPRRARQWAFKGKDGSLALPASPPGASIGKCQGNRLVAEFTLDEFD
jgi:hypothetical protein